MITVFHLNENYADELHEDIRDARCGFNIDEVVTNLWICGAYTAVASVKTDALETAFALTQSDDNLWYETLTHLVHVIGNPENWHTRVGDILVHNNTCYIVSRFGYIEGDFDVKANPNV